VTPVKGGDQRNHRGTTEHVNATSALAFSDALARFELLDAPGGKKVGFFERSVPGLDEREELPRVFLSSAGMSNSFLSCRSRGGAVLDKTIMARTSKKKDHQDDGPKTQARETFDANIEPMSALVTWLRPKEVMRATKSVTRATEKWIETKDKTDAKALTRATTSLTKSTNRWLGLHKFSFESMSVMLVVFLEAYLEDGLVALAIRKPALLKPAPESRRVFEVETLHELRDEMRRNWAQLKVHGGPERWEKMLTGMGARGYVKEDIYALQHLWDTRNLIVHSRSIMSASYARKHKALGAFSGTKIVIAGNLFTRWLTAITSFMDVTDAFFLKCGGEKTSADHGGLRFRSNSKNPSARVHPVRMRGYLPRTTSV
jgi:hypothetical protein